MQMEDVDQQLQQINARQSKDIINKDSKKLLQVKEELLSQKANLENAIDLGGLDPQEERRLIELGEALEAVDEALLFKEDLITQKRSGLNLNEDEFDHYKNVEHLLNDMGELSVGEYKHLLGKFFLKIIDLRKDSNQSDEARCHFEIKISTLEKQLLDMQHALRVVESRNERKSVENYRKHEKDKQFLMEQLRMMESEVLAKETEKYYDIYIYLFYTYVVHIHNVDEFDGFLFE